jgi:hypothetical protein
MPTTTAPMLLYSPQDSNKTTFIKSLFVCNTTAIAQTFSVWVNQVGSTTGDDKAIMKNFAIAAASADQRSFAGDSGIILVGSSASILVGASAASALTFTIYGYELVEN